MLSYSAAGCGLGLALVAESGGVTPGMIGTAGSHRTASNGWSGLCHLNTYWRGDLARMPARFVIHDVTGRRIASGSVDPGRGAALWNCSDVPAGVYILSVFDERGEPVATASFLKTSS